MAYQPQPITTSGGQQKVQVTDTDTKELFEQVLAELKKMNMHLQQITDENIEEGDL